MVRAALVPVVRLTMGCTVHMRTKIIVGCLGIHYPPTAEGLTFQVCFRCFYFLSLWSATMLMPFCVRPCMLGTWQVKSI